MPDDLTVRIWERHIQILEMQELLLPDQHTLILDGLPRNYAQAERLDHILDVVQIFHLQINDTGKASERLKTRPSENRLDDMNEEVIRRRLHTYYEETFKTLSFYPPELVFDVDASQAPLDVLRDIVNRLTEVQGGRLDPRPSAIWQADRPAGPSGRQPRSHVAENVLAVCGRAQIGKARKHPACPIGQSDEGDGLPDRRARAMSTGAEELPEMSGPPLRRGTDCRR